MQDLFTLSAAAFPPGARLAGFRGSEGLSRPYTFEVFVHLSHDLGQEVDMASAVGTRATLVLDPVARPPALTYDGIIASIKLLHELGERTVYRATLVPALWLLGNTMHSRVFTEQSIPDIIRAVLSENGVTEFAFDLSGSYATEEHVCQYRESDLDFVSRWMERLGMYYYFEHGGAEEKLVITDDKSTHGPLGPLPVRFVPQAGVEQSVGPAVRAITCEHSALPASVRVRDYDYARPALDVSGSAPAASAPAGRGQVNLYGERFFTPSAGARLAEVRGQAIRARQVVFHATGSATHLRSGYTFEIEDHPRPSFNARYLATSVTHYFNQAPGMPELADLLGLSHVEQYRAEVTAIPDTVQHRAEERTPWPRIYGFENALVDGPAQSDYAQIDEQGRYNVKLMFDEGTLSGGKASTRVRMLQPHGGSPEGFHFPLRKDTEVLCTFLGGDPDRPVIAGVVPNALTPSPVTLGNHMTNVIQTGGKNRLEMEDPAGSQRVTLSTPTQKTFLAMGAPVEGNHFTLSTEAHGYVQTGMNLGVLCNHKMSTHVVLDNEERYDQNHRVWVTADQQQSIKGDRTIDVKGDQGVAITGDHTFAVKGDENLSINGNRAHTITGDHTGTFLADHTLSVSGNHKHHIGGTSVVEIESDSTTSVGGSSSTTTDGSTSTTTHGDQTTILYGNKHSQVWGSSSSVTGGASSDLMLGLKDSTTIGATIDIKLALAFELFVGAKLAIAIGPKLDLAGIHLENKGAKMETTLTRIKSNIVNLEDKVASIEDSEVWVAMQDLALVL